MDTISVRCPRCATIHQVPATKAGHKGRCPKCGGIMHVPVPEPEPVVPVAHAGSPWPRRLMFLAPVVVGVILLIVVLATRGNGSAASGEPSPEEVAAVAKLRAVDREISDVEELVPELKRYDELYQIERRQQAREILRKIREYEPVSPEEYALRAEVRDAQGETTADWQLDSPLSAAEKAEWQRTGRELEQQAKAIQQKLDGVGIGVELQIDSAGRALLRRSEIDQKLAEERERLAQRRTEAEQQLQAIRRKR